MFVPVSFLVLDRWIWKDFWSFVFFNLLIAVIPYDHKWDVFTYFQVKVYISCTLVYECLCVYVCLRYIACHMCYKHFPVVYLHLHLVDIIWFYFFKFITFNSSILFLVFLMLINSYDQCFTLFYKKDQFLWLIFICKIKTFNHLEFIWV